MLVGRTPMYPVAKFLAGILNLDAATNGLPPIKVIVAVVAVVYPEPGLVIVTEAITPPDRLATPCAGYPPFTLGVLNITSGA